MTPGIHQHSWEDVDGTAMLSTGRIVMQIQHRCSCGEIGVGPSIWCERERRHNHTYEQIPPDPLKWRPV